MSRYYAFVSSPSGLGALIGMTDAESVRVACRNLGAEFVEDNVYGAINAHIIIPIGSQSIKLNITVTDREFPLVTSPAHFRELVEVWMRDVDLLG